MDSTISLPMNMKELQKELLQFSIHRKNQHIQLLQLIFQGIKKFQEKKERNNEKNEFQNIDINL